MSDDITKLLDRLLAGYSHSFIVLNWDIVLERHLQSLPWPHGFEYGVAEIPWDGRYGSSALLTEIIKVHGSANWVYCDNCRQVYFDPDSKLSLDVNAGLLDDDFLLFDKKWPMNEIERLTLGNRNCLSCGSPLGPHIATFSYRKSFRSNAFARSWATAEERLSAANRWLFIGYSLPQADYEFVHLLKTAGLKLARLDRRPIKMHVVVKDDVKAEERYRQIFGSAIELVEQRGLEEYLPTGLSELLA